MCGSPRTTELLRERLMVKCCSRAASSHLAFFCTLGLDLLTVILRVSSEGVNVNKYSFSAALLVDCCRYSFRGFFITVCCCITGPALRDERELCGV